jgi:hypothetical protein
MKGWLVNDCLTCIPGTRTFWHDLLSWFPELADNTEGYTDYRVLADRIESQLTKNKPDYIIRNGSYFRSIRTDVKTVCLIQDVQTGDGLQNQIDIINHSSVAVFNTNYVYQKYRQYISSSIAVRVCPLGVNFDFFKPSEDRHPDVLPDSVIYIGSSMNYPKGFNVLLSIIHSMPDQTFCLVMKDDFSINGIPPEDRHRVRIFNRVNQEMVRLLINSCIAAVCTSYEETQHLSGIECAACNIPIVARMVGVYYDYKKKKYIPITLVLLPEQLESLNAVKDSEYNTIYNAKSRIGELTSKAKFFDPNPLERIIFKREKK